jgi:hypothetical protein
LKKLAMLLVSMSLVGCQGTDSHHLIAPDAPTLHSTRDITVRPAKPDLGYDCSAYDASFNPNGGKLAFPVVDQSYAGSLGYASADGGGGAAFYACPGTDNSFGMPVPRGHTPDWFGELRFLFSATFAQADLYGKMSAPVWLPRTDYYLYLYDGKYHHVGSYKIGRANVKNSQLKFPSPFENGFAMPTDGILYLEIAHRSK